ncbi:MAG: UDP-N-acetylenolpyruvoylglucosamine reductase [Omnitrophica WOR_2 bacterium RIFCSPHIGHO2_02_FULL_63_39]|nr:MAG: UDP-N-acetylenolpyruvoylglucosamine reductase [Omnitrophica WOR_2 bacterium GWA2_63_20]OGX17775.1 MAG: UDP-N-acetylenolpyruvoylglucosamine reductase [Omnitrophica WOR_2 bacterium GWF2_63_9]OGX34777.1 MAG: UDP-N-acetylenolpyruvoylglucosamine reductase [Omnitrophica WOR_2 bacterium RIFCSPHIGHO2_02_FULL_63_39]OGX48838.1 MAG: UDP-N-acetylenolpyruvoylglucosamine reductase [Omnitrophica WOR_2 bacterium RIFCSPLOWO2_12_FULL_63_16]
MTWPSAGVRSTELLANHTSFRIGGPAEWFAEPHGLDELLGLLREANRQGILVSVIGGGTNLLVADRGVRGLVISLRRGRPFRLVEVLSQEGEPQVRVRCGSAVYTQQLVTLGGCHGWGGVDLLAGLPGQIGGAMVMNAQNIGQRVERIRVVSWAGSVQELTRDQLAFAYRYTRLPPGIVVDATLRFERADPTATVARIQHVLQHRNATQEVTLPSAGCAFKNPPGESAGRLIDRAGLKGARIGDARISPRHANFLVNLGRATCDDVLSLMDYVQRRVVRATGILLEPEVRLLGERW